MKTKSKFVSLVCLLAGLATLPVVMLSAASPAPEPPAAPNAPEPPPPPQRAFLGVVTEKVASSTVAQLGLTPGIGLTVDSVVKGSSADLGGIEAYDILLEMDGQWLTSVAHLSTLLSMKKPGDRATFGVLRKGKELTVEVELGAKPVGDAETSWEWEFEEKMEAIGRRLEAIAENEELMEHVRQRIDPEELEENVKSALEKARYQIRQWVSDDGSHTSIVHTGNARSIVTSDDGTLIHERLPDGSSRVIAINDEDEVLFNGVISDPEALADLEPWVAREFEKLAERRIEVTVTDALETDREPTEK